MKKVFLTGCAAALSLAMLSPPACAFDPYRLEPYVFTENADETLNFPYTPRDQTDLMPETANPVNLKAGTRVFWNEKDITQDAALYREPTLEELLDERNHRVYYGLTYNVPYSKGAQDNWPPCDGFSIVSTQPETVGQFSEFTTNTPLLFIWNTYGDVDVSSGGYLTFACNGKTVQSVSFSGLPDDALTELRPDGIGLRFSQPGTYRLTYEVTDSDGVTRAYPTTYTFEIHSPDSVDYDSDTVS